MARIAKAAKNRHDDAAPLDPNPLLTASEAAHFLGVSTRTLSTWRQHETGPAFVRLSRKTIKYRSIDLQRWAQRAVATPLANDEPHRVTKREGADV